MPKGVDVKHGSMTNALLLEPGRLRITVGSKVAQVLSISFAMGKPANVMTKKAILISHQGAWEMLGSLVNGGTLYLRGSDWNATLAQVSLVCLCDWMDVANHSIRSTPSSALLPSLPSTSRKTTRTFKQWSLQGKHVLNRECSASHISSFR